VIERRTGCPYKPMCNSFPIELFLATNQQYI